MDLRRALGDAARYRRQIDRLHQRYLFSRELYELKQGDVPLARLVHHRRRVGRMLARSVRKGTYRFEPGIQRRIVVKGKEREVYAFRLTDLVVHGVVGALIQEASLPLLSDRLYSYRSGVSWWSGISDLAGYARAHRKSRPDPRDRGLYVLRRDIDAYTDSIPVGGHSPVWSMLRSLFEEPVRPEDWDVIEQVARPVMETPPDGPVMRSRGVPTGQPISVALFNLYLSSFDHAFDAIPDGFYARYSDDIVFAHHDPGMVKDVRDRMDDLLVDLDLRFKPEKEQVLYLTTPGRPSTEWGEARGASWVPFLGTQVWADGSVSLGTSKTRGLLRDIRDRARRTARAATGDVDATGRAVTNVVNEALDPRHSPFEQRSATLLQRAVTDRRQLRQLDYQIARIVIGAATGQGDVRAFRRVPYRTVRGDWGLLSLEHARNRWGKRAAR
jgi:hypothetical protein